MSGQPGPLAGGDDDELLHPPAYYDAEGRSIVGNNNAHEEDDLLPPVILIMCGRFVHPESARASPLYELSQDVDRLSSAYSTHTLERLEHGVAITARNVPRITRRRRKVYNLKHVSPALSPNFPFQAEALSRQSMGNLGLCRRSGAAGLHVPYFQTGEGTSRVVLLKERSDGGAGLPKGYNAFRHAEMEAGEVFEFQQRRRQKKKLVSAAAMGSMNGPWRTGGRLAIEDDADGQHKLVVTSAVTRQTMDALVACWCLRLWRNNYDTEPGLHGWDRFTNKVRDVRQKLALAPAPSFF
ncbi:uncharacterized protein PG986_015108 [Apiospora aurea]|uniref:Uncharacterized protein n=1 Tax=Apiospora aurea TaxID=335848 RepID=A0ABR1PRM2_9PEZI